MLLVASAYALLCHTPAMRQVQAAEGARFADYRPTSSGWVDSDVYPVRVHYKSLDHADRARDVVLPAVEYSWLVQIDQMGWPSPPLDGGA